MSYFGKGSGYWRQLTEDKVEALVTFENAKQKTYWDNWIKIYSKIYGK